MGLANVIEREHYKRKKQDRRNRGNPVRMTNKNSILVCRGRVTHHFERPQIRGNETQAGNPSGHIPSRHKEFFAGVGEFFQVKSQTKDQDEIEGNDGQVNRTKRHYSRLRQNNRQQRRRSWK